MKRKTTSTYKTPWIKQEDNFEAHHRDQYMIYCFNHIYHSKDILNYPLINSMNQKSVTLYITLSFNIWIEIFIFYPFKRENHMLIASRYTNHFDEVNKLRIWLHEQVHQNWNDNHYLYKRCLMMIKRNYDHHNTDIGKHHV